MRKLLYIISSAFALASCEVEFSLENMDVKPKLYVESIVGVSDTTIIRVQRTVAVNESIAHEDLYIKTDVRMKINGNDVPLKCSDGTDGTVPNGGWWTVEQIGAGDVVELTASAEGLDPVSARTEVPSAPPAFTVDDRGDNAYTFRFQDDAATADHYALLIMTESRKTMDDESVFMCNRVQSWDTDFTETYFYHGTRHRNVILYDDKPFNGREAALFYKAITDEVPYYKELEYVFYRQHFYLLRMSDDMHNWLMTRYRMDNDNFSGMGLASPIFSYSNIEMGAGIFASASYSKITTDWSEYHYQRW